MSKAQAFLDVLGSMARRVKPSNEEDIVRAILAQRSAMESSPLGFTMDPRTGRMLNVGNDVGYSMATVPENPALNRSMTGKLTVDAAGNETIPIDEAALESLIRNPYYMDELTTGANFGGWFDKSTGEFVLDPSRRFLNKDRSIVLGSQAGQKAGFDLGAIDEYKLTPEVVQEAARQEALRKLRRIMGAGAGGLAGADLLSRRD
jgi:hypothetical protein